MTIQQIINKIASLYDDPKSARSIIESHICEQVLLLDNGSSLSWSAFLSQQRRLYKNRLENNSPHRHDLLKIDLSGGVYEGGNYGESNQIVSLEYYDNEPLEGFEYEDSNISNIFDDYDNSPLN